MKDDWERRRRIRVEPAFIWKVGSLEKLFISIPKAHADVHDSASVEKKLVELK